MGYKTEINYILKASSKEEGDYLRNNLNPSQPFKIKKSGLRTYVLNAPIMFADENWKILGMCTIVESKISSIETELLAIILTVFSPEESETVTRLTQEGETALK